MKFALSYSGGKDSVLAFFRAIGLGHEPVALVTTYNETRQNSHFHKIPFSLLQQAADSLRVPLRLIKTQGDQYAKDFEACLSDLKDQGVELCVFGDIDLEEHFTWCNDRCVNVGIKSLFPLRYGDRRGLVEEFIEADFKSIITVVDTNRMNSAYLGQILSHTVIDRLADDGVDVCGENGEYHSFVFDGPIFTSPVQFSQGEITTDDHYAFLPLMNKGNKNG
ncbi:MAG: diphthine--ammonia ligase [Clostridiaceae bacterium]